MSDLPKFDAWLTTDDFAALVIREHLESVEGPDGVIFPATYAAAEDKKVFPGGYNIDPPEGDKNVCLIDSVGSQANRIEPMFMSSKHEGKYARLVPQVNVKAGEKTVTIFEAGHRAGDALVRCTTLQADLQKAFKTAGRGNAMELAQIAPTSLVFGVWDSRDTQVKLPRLVASTIRAFDVVKLKRSAQYNPSTDYIGQKLLDETTDKNLKDAYAERGFVHVPATGSHGGVIAKGGVRRDSTLSLAALRLLAAENATDTLKLRRYILGLSLVAFTANASTYLRQGCNLVPSEKGRELMVVHSDGKREASKLTHADAVAFATEAAKVFGVGEGKTVEFDPALAKRDISGENDTKQTAKARDKKAAAAAAKAAKDATTATDVAKGD
jgi:CRISPR-associated protein Csb1